MSQYFLVNSKVSFHVKLAYRSKISERVDIYAKNNFMIQA